MTKRDLVICKEAIKKNELAYWEDKKITTALFWFQINGLCPTCGSSNTKTEHAVHVGPPIIRFFIDKYRDSGKCLHCGYYVQRTWVGDY